MNLILPEVNFEFGFDKSKSECSPQLLRGLITVSFDPANKFVTAVPYTADVAVSCSPFETDIEESQC